MKTFIFLICTATFSLNSNFVFSQGAKIKIDYDKVITVDEVFKMIKEQTNYRFVYKSDMFKDLPKVKLSKGIILANKLLAVSLSSTDFDFLIKGEKTVIINEKLKKQLTISGKVTDAKGLSLVGATILIKGTLKGVNTDLDGYYNITASIGDILVFSFLGKQTAEVEVTNDTTINLVLQDSEEYLEEIVLIGYGTQKRKEITGSVSKINIKSLNNQVPVNFDNALVGRAPGVYVTPSNGMPGSSAAIRIRGMTSVIGNNEPLYIIDGIPIEIGLGESNATFKNSSSNQISPLSSINPQDIESIDVLKDASATAIYGSRASNGVIIVTTKKGSQNTPSVTFNMFTTISNITEKSRMLNSAQFQNVIEQGYTNVGRPVPNDNVLYPYGRDVDTDWIGGISQTGIDRNYYINIGGSAAKQTTFYSLSAGLLDQEGTITGTGFKRSNVRIKVESQPIDKIKIGGIINYSDSRQKGNPELYRPATTEPPFIPIRDENGEFASISIFSNPFQLATFPQYIDNENLAMSLFGEFKLTENLIFKSVFSNNKIKGASYNYSPSTSSINQLLGVNGTLELFDNNFNSKIFDNTLTYNFALGNHLLNGVIGMSHTQNASFINTTYAENFPDDDVSVYPGAADFAFLSNSGRVSGLESYFFRANYSIANTYYITFTGRADQSTKFGPNNRWGYFPSGAVAWRLSNEKFLKPVSFINNLKLRASYGKTGAANFDDFQYKTFFSSGNFYNDNNGITANVIPNPSIKWETTNQLDIALEYVMFNQRISGSVGYFNKRTTDQILLKDIVYETGGKSQFSNVGDFSNQGFEFLLGIDVFRDTKVKWTSELNLSTIKSEVLKLNDGFFEGLKEGEPIDAFYGYKVAGIFQTQEEIDVLNATSPTNFYQRSGTAPGDFKFVDVNNDGVVNAEDETILGHAAPDIFGGWNNTISFGNFEISALFNFSIGNTITNLGKRTESLFFWERTNSGKGVLNAWTPENTDTNVPRVAYRDPNNNRRLSDFFIEDGSFLKLKNILLSYRLSPKLLAKYGIKNASISLSANNVFTITPYSGFDPEINEDYTDNFGQGVDIQSYPNSRQFIVGINLNF
ncbi:TonB-dependent receptor [uncultured Polaribacter sp.]|uniref:SusC/RagA family TonB-linked outer membrane protein n=1 Tax=uncultured Polaribacter sp. TaxID=174711 RepID=UPI00261A2740|nr:TonB-dependent receptor [uncultured Polaribacter sp.]